jgi:RND family efflux transporter MFP subunit
MDEHHSAPAETAGPAHDHESIGELPRAPEPSRKVLAGLLTGFLALLAVAFAAGLLPRIRKSAALDAETSRLATRRPPVQVTSPKVRPPSNEISLPGTVQPLQDTVIYARTSGYLRRWLVDIGDQVKTGQLLAEIDTPEVDDQLRGAQAALGEAEAALVQAKTQVELARVSVKRVDALAPSGFSSQQDKDEKEAAFHVAEANVAAAEAKVASQKAEVQRLTHLKDFARVLAPFDGTITFRSTEVGSLIAAGGGAGQALFRLAKTAVVRVFVNVPQNVAASVHAGVTTKVYVRELAGHPFTGKVTRTARALDNATHTLLAEVDVPNKDGALLTGTYVEVGFTVTSSIPELSLPSSSFLFGAAGPRIAVVDGNDTVHVKPVRLGEDYGNEIGVVEGVSAEDKVLLNPGDNAVEGLAVTILPPKGA